MCQKTKKILGSNLEHLPVVKALRGDDQWFEHLPHREDPQVLSGTTLLQPLSEFFTDHGGLRTRDSQIRDVHFLIKTPK